MAIVLAPVTRNKKNDYRQTNSYALVQSTVTAVCKSQAMENSIYIKLMNILGRFPVRYEVARQTTKMLSIKLIKPIIFKTTLTNLNILVFIMKDKLQELGIHKYIIL